MAAPEPANIDHWVSSAEQNNYSVVAAEITQEVAKRAISLNRAGHLPTVDLVMGVNHTKSAAIPAQQLPSLLETSRNIGIQFNIPLFAGNGVNSQVREAIALEDKAGNDVAAAKRTAALLVRQAFLGVNSGLAQVQAYEAAEVSGKLAVESVTFGYKIGARINVDVLDAQQKLYTTQQNLAKARYETLINGIRLKAAAGILTVDDLIRLNQLLH